jgi:hypothetical protein
VPILFDIRIGSHWRGACRQRQLRSDEELHGNGDTVNLASRLEGANKGYGSRILASESTIAAADAAIEAREIDRVALVGQNQPQAIYEIMGRKGALTPQQIDLRTRYNEGLKAYRNKQWEEARAHSAQLRRWCRPTGPPQRCSTVLKFLPQRLRPTTGTAHGASSKNERSHCRRRARQTHTP